MKSKKEIMVISDRCNTTYPLVFVHGIGYRDNWFVKYWGRIPNVLKANGTDRIFYGHTEAWGTIKDNAQILKDKVLEVLKETGATKVNIITHSKGGLDARYMISSLNMGDSVASLTTIAAPHHGSKSADVYAKFPKWFRRFISFFPNTWYRLCGDKKPNFYAVMDEITSKACEKFNESNQDAQGVYYQSYATLMKHFYSDIFMMLPYLVIKLFDGQSDGLVTPKSAEWTNFKGVIQSAGRRGISHADSIDLRRRRLTKKKSEGLCSDITDFYLDLVDELRQMGF